MPRKQDSEKDRPKGNGKTPKKQKRNTSQKKSKKRNDTKKVYKKSDGSDSDREWIPENEVEDMSTIEMQRLMQQMFPSNAGRTRLNKLEKLEKLKAKKVKKHVFKKLNKKKVSSEEEEEFDENEVLDALVRDIKGKNMIIMRSDNLNEEDNEDDDEDYEDEEDEDVDDYEDINGHLVDDSEEMNEDEIMNMLGQNMQFNIVFTVNDKEMQDSLID